MPPCNPNPMTEKACTKCGEVKSLSEYHRHRGMKDGRAAACGSCQRAASRAWHKANPKRTARNRQRWKQENRAKVAAMSASWERKNPEKTRAQSTVAYAIKKGDLVRPDACEDCGESCMPHAHHPDYSKPYEVMWLCRPCHGKAHKRYAETTE